MLVDILLLVVFVGLYAGTSVIVHATGGFWPYPSVQGGLSPHKALLLYGALLSAPRRTRPLPLLLLCRVRLLTLPACL